MKEIRRSSQVLTLVLVILASSSVFLGVELAWATDGPTPLSMSTVEDVTILENGGARLALLINVAASPLADMYRDMLAAPPDAGVGEEMPIPENKTENGVVMPVKEEYHRSIKQEQKNSFGFLMCISDSSMMPSGEQDELRVSINACASLQVVNFTAVGSDGIWEIVVGPRDQNATRIGAGALITRITSAQSLLDSLEGDQVYEVYRSVRIRVPVGATLLNGDDLAGLSWAVSFGGSTSTSASVSVNDTSTVLLNERTVVTEQNITATPMEIFEAFRGYETFKIKYFLPGSASIGGESPAMSYDQDWSHTFNTEDWKLRKVWEPTISTTDGATIKAHLIVTATFSFQIYVGWDFEWWGSVNWFEAWIGAAVTFEIELGWNVTATYSKHWETTLFDLTLFRIPTMVDYVPVWWDVDLVLRPTLDVGVEGTLSFQSLDVNLGGYFRLGARWSRDSGWSIIKDGDFDVFFDPPTVVLRGSAWVESSLKFRIAVLCYSTAGPYVEFEPYVRGQLTWVAGDEVITWQIKVGFRINVFIMFKGWLQKLLHISDFTLTPVDREIKSWSGYWGQAPRSISIETWPHVIRRGAGTTIKGRISSKYEGSQSDTVYIQYSIDGETWSRLAAVKSSDGGSYSARWYPRYTGTYYFRSYVNGNFYYKEAESSNVAELNVSSPVPGEEDVAYDDGEEPDATVLCGGLAVRFTPPMEPWLLQKIRICGLTRAPNVDLYVEIWDSSGHELWNHSFRSGGEYGFEGFITYNSTNWAEIDLVYLGASRMVTGDFYVVVYSGWLISPAYPVVSVGVDTREPISDRSFIVDPQNNTILKRYDIGSFMIRPYGTWRFDNWPILCKDINWSNPWDPIPTNITRTFYTDEDAYVWIDIQGPFEPDVSYQSCYEIQGPDGDYIWSSPFIDMHPGTGEYGHYGETQIMSISIADSDWLLQYLDKDLTLKVYVFETSAINPPYTNNIDTLPRETTFRVIARESNITITSSSDSIIYGQSVQISAQISPSVSVGTTTFEYSTDGTHWTGLSSGTPSSGNYSGDWIPPHAGTYYIRAYWSGNIALYNSTSPTLTLTVDKASTSLTISLPSTIILERSSVTITTSIMPALQGRNITLQYSVNGSMWYYLGSGTMNATGQDATSWTPPWAGDYYIRSMWDGETDYLGSISLSYHLVVEQGHPTQVEIVTGLDAEVDRTSSATLEFGVRVKDLKTGQNIINTGIVEFYVSDQSRFNVIIAGTDDDSDGNGVYNITWSTGDWPLQTGPGNWSFLGPQHWSAQFMGTPEYMPSPVASTNLTIYYQGVALWIDPLIDRTIDPTTYPTANISSSKQYTINLESNRDTADTFTLSLTGLDPSWYTLSQTSITLESRGHIGQVTLTILPPNAPAILRDYEFTVTATSQTSSSFSVSAIATVRVDFTPTPPSSPTGELATAVQPEAFYTSAGTKVIINILVTNNQNFDDVIEIDIRNTGIQPQYQASLAWFNWLRVTVFLPEGASIFIPLEIELPSGTPLGTHDFRAVATSTTNLAIAAEAVGRIIHTDITPPITIIILTGTSGLNGWYVSDVTIAFTATDDVSLVASTKYSFDGTNWITYTGLITISSEGTTTIYYRSIDAAGNIEPIKTATLGLDKTPPTTTLTIGEPKYISDRTYVTLDTPFTLEATDAISGAYSTAYRAYNATYDGGWQTYTAPFKLTSLTDGTYTIEYYSIDNAGNVGTAQRVSVTLDNYGPSIVVENPPPGWALQDGVTFLASTSDSSGTQSLNFSIREANGDEGTPVGFENIPATYIATTGKWELFFDTLQVPDGFYIVLAKAEDNLGHTASIKVPYSIRNWAVLKLLPATVNNKAGRTMPVKFSLRVAATVDPNQPFVYNEELVIKIYATDNPTSILQASRFGDGARDYRINTISEQYITNFKTLKTPRTYAVEIYKKNMLLGTFGFKTVK